MSMTEDEKKLLQIYRKLESRRCKEDIIFCTETVLRSQEAFKADYGLVGSPTPLFNGLGMETMA